MKNTLPSRGICTAIHQRKDAAIHQNINEFESLPSFTLEITIPSPLSLDRSSQSTARESLSSSLVAGESTSASCTTTSTPSTTTTATSWSTTLESVSRTLRSLLKSLLVALNEPTGLVGHGESKHLQSRKFDALAEDDGVVNLVQSSSQLLIGNHLGHNGLHFLCRE